MLKEEVKTGKFKIAFKKEKAKEPPKKGNGLNTQSNDGNENENEENWYLNFNIIDFYSNEKLFQLDKQSTRFDLVSTDQAIKTEYLFDESDNSKQTTIRSLNDCYLHCLNLNTDRIVCHSFTYCIGDSKTVPNTCHFSNLYFDKELEKLESLEKKKKLAKKDDRDTIEDNEKGKYSKWIEKSTGCNVFNLAYKNFFSAEDDRTIEEATKTENDLTLEECFSDCYRTTKGLQADNDQDDELCRSIEFCVSEEKVNESDLRKTSVCKSSNLESKYLAKKDLKDESKRNCKVYDCKFVNFFKKCILRCAMKS